MRGAGAERSPWTCVPVERIHEILNGAIHVDAHTMPEQL